MNFDSGKELPLPLGKGDSFPKSAQFGKIIPNLGNQL
jgi:hypothetical protein